MAFYDYACKKRKQLCAKNNWGNTTILQKSQLLKLSKPVVTFEVFRSKGKAIIHQNNFQ